MTRATAAKTGPVLLYRATCPRCRFLSRLLVGLSLGTLRRIPVDSDEARELYDLHGQERGKLAVLHRGRFTTGGRIVPALGIAIAEACLRRVVPRPESPPT